jgi:hypothetical protein
MAKIIVGFSTSTHLLSKFIRFMTNAPFSHAYIRVPVPEFNTSIVFQASGLSVNYTNYEYFLTSNTVVEEMEIEVSDEQAKIAESLRVTECGKPYSLKELFGFSWIMFLRIFHKKVGNPFYDGNSGYICVELISKSLGIQDKSTLTPIDLYNILKCR